MPVDIREVFGARVRALRETAGLTQEDLADLAHLHRNYIGGIERGERNPTLVNIEKLAAALRVPIASLLESTVPPRRQRRPR